MFFCKDIFGDVPKAFPVKGMKTNLGTSNFLETSILSYRRLVLSFVASRVFPLVWFWLVRVRGIVPILPQEKMASESELD